VGLISKPGGCRGFEQEARKSLSFEIGKTADSFGYFGFYKNSFETEDDRFLGYSAV
jgi:hypothetical protein